MKDWIDGGTSLLVYLRLGHVAQSPVPSSHPIVERCERRGCRLFMTGGRVNVRVVLPWGYIRLICHFLLNVENSVCPSEKSGSRS